MILFYIGAVNETLLHGKGQYEIDHVQEKWLILNGDAAILDITESIIGNTFNGVR